MVEHLTVTLNLIKIIEIVLGVIIIPVVVWLYNLIQGMKCQLRHDMLHIYYKYENRKEIRQYEYENFVLMYKSYKSLRGNSFIDKIMDDISQWKIIS